MWVYYYNGGSKPSLLAGQQLSRNDYDQEYMKSTLKANRKGRITSGGPNEVFTSNFNQNYPFGLT